MAASPTRRNFVAGTAAFASIGMLVRTSRAASEPTVFKWAHTTQVEHPLNVNAVRVKNAVAKRSNGRLRIEIYPNSQLGGDQAMFSQVRSGAIQIYSGFGGIYSTVAPLAGIEAVGFAFKTQAQALRAMDGALGKMIRADIDTKAGVVTFDRAWVNGFREVTTSTHPIRTVADMQGLKIRTPTAPIWVDMFSALGAAPTPINANEMYVALQTHVVDAQENPFVIELTFKLYEVQKYLSVTNHMWSNFWVVSNAEAYHALPNDLQRILSDATNEFALTNRVETEDLNDSLRDKLGRLGMTINDVDTRPFRARLAASGFYAKYKNQYGSQAWDLLEQSVGKLG